MGSTPINEVLNDAFRDTVANWKKEGMSDEEIISRLKRLTLMM